MMSFLTFAYIGPGAGLGLFWALATVAAATFSALAFVLLWPLRRLVRKLKGTAFAEGVASDHLRTADRGSLADAQHRNERHDQPTHRLS